MVFEGLVGADCCSQHCVRSIDNPGLCASSAGDRHTVTVHMCPRQAELRAPEKTKREEREAESSRGGGRGAAKRKLALQ